MRTRLKKIIYHKFELKYKIENNKTFKKGQWKKNKDQIEKKYDKLGWRMKLKINKFLQKIEKKIKKN
jgi:hypothetical protein